jgi:hypothetical protein
MMIRFVNYLAVAAFALVTLGMRTEAHADYVTVRVDNETNPSHYANAKSTGTLKVCIFVDGSATAFQCVYDVLSFVDHAHNYNFNDLGPGKDWSNVSKVSFTFQGAKADTDDLLVVDQTELCTPAGTAERTDGIDNEKGRCFSSDPSDASNSHCSSFVAANTPYYWFP